MHLIGTVDVSELIDMELPKWERSTGGYLWDGEVRPLSWPAGSTHYPDRSGQKWLVMKHPDADVIRFSLNTENPGLYRSFASLCALLPVAGDAGEAVGGKKRDSSGFESATAAFAGKHGFLGIGDASGMVRGAFTDHGPAESIFGWRNEVVAVSYISFLWDLVRAYDEDPERLNNRIVDDRQADSSWFELINPDPPSLTEDEGRLVRPDFERVRFVYSPKALPDDVKNDYKPAYELPYVSDAVLDQARAAIRYQLNRKLRSHPMLTQIDWRQRGRKAPFELYPSSLIGAIYAQMAKELAGGRAQQSCEFCGDWFTPKRSDAKYCSGKCRTAASRAGPSGEAGKDG